MGVSPEALAAGSVVRFRLVDDGGLVIDRGLLVRLLFVRLCLSGA